jgi:hypothetical protein
VAAPPIRGSGT